MNDPTTTGLETTDYPIWNIDFPGVTICPNTKVDSINIILKNLALTAGYKQVQGCISRSKPPMGEVV